MSDESFNSQEELDEINQEDEEFEANKDIVYEIKLYLRLLRRKFSAYIRKKSNKDFEDILYVTDNEIPMSYIQKFRQQYPDKNFKIILPSGVLRKENQKITHFECFVQNKNFKIILFKRPANVDNIEIYEIYSEYFDGISQAEKSKNLCYIALFMRAFRECARFLKPEIIHSDNLPIFLGSDFDAKPFNTKAVITLNDINSEEFQKDLFWVCINILNRNSIKKLLRDKYIRKNVSALFKIRTIQEAAKMEECIEYMYKNFENYRAKIKFDESIRENEIINNLNKRAVQLFPQLSYGEGLYNCFASSVKKASKIVLNSKTQYKNIQSKSDIKNFRDKFAYVISCTDLKDNEIYKSYDLTNFREFKIYNKKSVLRELSQNRVKTDFIDKTLFAEDTRKIRGFLSNVETPLIYSSIDNSYSQGFDIVLTSVLKMFELQRNVQFIINIPQGLGDEKIKKWVDFIEDDLMFLGKVVFIDGVVNSAKFLAASDMVLLPYRTNVNSFLLCEALKYGCIPIASNVGFLNDMVVDIFGDIVKGCGFKANFDNMEFQMKEYFEVLTKALNFYQQNSAGWNLIIKNAMNSDCSWNFNSLSKYNEIYEDL